ncbi:MAG TPA: hypothetical protein VE132_12925 [Micromonosporaceae bacterium]|jgi:hypothetical protein|nr:hypothetical protein [Micromonosporaceae bacterium]
MDQGFSAYEVDSWCEAIDQLHDYAMRHAYSRRDVEYAVGRELSRWGYLAAPIPVLQMMSRAVESGYAFALRDIQEGSYDREIAQWRPALGRARP